MGIRCGTTTGESAKFWMNELPDSVNAVVPDARQHRARPVSDLLQESIRSPEAVSPQVQGLERQHKTSADVGGKSREVKAQIGVTRSLLLLGR